jgi:steroid 5-alpha reductase family enzyme
MVFLQTWLSSFLFVMVFLVILWLCSIKIKNVSIIDPFWGLGFIIIALFSQWMTNNYSARAVLVIGLIAIWGLRLSIYLFIRNRGHGEDPRYQKFRKSYGEHRYWWFSFFQVFLLQGVIMALVALPLVSVIVTQNTTPLNHWDAVFAVLWLVGFIFEAGGDLQLALFKRNPENKGKVMDRGFWRYTRHPNYFGNSVIWWSIGLFGLFYGAVFTLIGPVLMTFLLVKVSGVGLLEKTLRHTKPKYEDYIKSTSSFIPWLPQKRP